MAIKQLHREMGFSPSEWQRCLQRAMTVWQQNHLIQHQATWQTQSLQIGLTDGTKVTMIWQRLSPRTIALISLPRMAVTWTYEAQSEMAFGLFLEHLDRYLHKGGG